MRLRSFATLATVVVLIRAETAVSQEVRRAIPVEPPTAPAVPFDFDNPSPAPTATPKPTPRPTPRLTPVPVATPKPQATTTPSPDQPVQTQPQPMVSPSVEPPAAVPSATPALIQAQTPDKEQIEYANSFYAKKMYEMAAPEYEKYLGIYVGGPDRQMAYFRLGESYRAIGSLNAAKNAYETLLTTYTTGDFVGPAAYRLADMYFQENNYEMALPLFRRASVRVTDKAVANSAKFNAARCLENLRSLGEAKSIYEELADTRVNNPFREASRLALARILTLQDKKVEAHKQYEILAKETDKPEIRMEALVKAALLKIDLGQNDKAATDLEKALQSPEIGQWKEIAAVGLLHAYYDSGKYKRLAETYEAHAKDFSTDVLPEVLMMAANANRKLANYKEARTLYDQVIKNYPDSSHAKEAQFQRLVSLYNADDASLIGEIDKFLTQNPASDKKDQVLLLKAEALYRKQDYANAAPIYAGLDKSTLPEDLRADAQFKLGWCQMQIKDYQDAISSFSAFIFEHPKHKLAPSALTQLALANQKTKNFSAALENFDKLIKEYPKAKERELALQQKALLLGQQGDNQGMSDTFKRLLHDYPDTVAAGQANYWIGWAAFDAKNYKEAVPPLIAARKEDKDQFYDKATLFIMSAYLCLEDKEKLAAEVDAFSKTNSKIKIPIEVLRWLGTQYLNDKNYERAETYLTMLTSRKDEAVADDWLNLGRSIASQKRYDDAAKYFTIYLESAKDPVPRATGLLALGDSQLGLGKFDDAQKSVDEACRLQPEGRLNAEGRIMAGEIQMARGSYDSAAKLFQSVSVILDDPEITPHAMELACDALKRAGKDADAAKVYNDLQTRYGEYLQKKEQKQGQ